MAMSSWPVERMSNAVATSSMNCNAIRHQATASKLGASRRCRGRAGAAWPSSGSSRLFADEHIAAWTIVARVSWTTKSAPTPGLAVTSIAVVSISGTTDAEEGGGGQKSMRGGSRGCRRDVALGDDLAGDPGVLCSLGAPRCMALGVPMKAASIPRRTRRQPPLGLPEVCCEQTAIRA